MLFAHRGLHDGAPENSILAFALALETMDGFECDVRLSRDGVPVVVHDATLRRTHGVQRRAHDMLVEELKELDVPTLEATLELLSTSATSKTAVLDLKVDPEKLVPLTLKMLSRLRVSPAQIVFLVWRRVPPSISNSSATLLRATDYEFRSHEWASGVACKFDGSPKNVKCIRRVLSEGRHVNLFSPDRRRTARMLRLFGHVPNCSMTL